MTFQFTIAQLHEPLTLYWPQVQEVAKSFGDFVVSDLIWNVFNGIIDNANDYTRHPEKFNVPRLDFISDASLQTLATQFFGSSEVRVDFWSFRIEVFKLLSNFSEMAEKKNRSLIPILLDVYENEFQSVTATSKKHDDLTVQRGKYNIENQEKEQEDNEEEMEVDKEEDSEENKDAEEDTEMDVVPEEQKLVHQLNRKLVKNTIRQVLNIFSKFGNLKSVYRSNDLLDVIHELLRCEETDIQKAALDCLFNFKFKKLDLYKENFENLVADKQFSDELIHFSIDEESTIVKSEHRDEVIPILMKILDGKLHSKVGRKGVSKRPAIFRFVAGCKPEELELFLKTVFWSVNALIGKKIVTVYIIFINT